MAVAKGSMNRFLYIVFVVVAGACCAQSGRSPRELRQNALALEQQGKSDEAEAAWRALSKLQPGDPEPYAQVGLIEAREQRYKEAVLLYRKALAINPNVPGLRVNLALALFKAGELKEAIPQLELVRKSVGAGSQEYWRTTTLIGMSYYGQAEYPQAVPYLKEAAEGDPNSLPLLLALAHSYLWSKQYKSVLDVYKQILTLAPDSAEADMLAGEALDEMKDNEGSTNMFRAAVKANPKEPNVHFGLGYLLWTQKQYPEAAQEFQAELANDPNHAQATLYLADADIQMNKQGEAEPLLRRVIKFNPEFGLAHLDLGIIASDAGRIEEALKELTLAEKQMPNEVNVHWRLGRLYRTMGNKELAKAEFDKASTLNKQADEELYKKIAAGAARGPRSEAQTPQPAVPAQ